MNFPKPETIQRRIDEALREVKRLKLLLKMSELYEPKTPQAGKEASPQDPGGHAK